MMRNSLKLLVSSAAASFAGHSTMLSVFFLAMFLYPIWGVALLVLLCIWLRVYGSYVKRLFVSFLVAILGATLFTPAVWGTEGFAFMPPWPVVFIDPRHSQFFWQFGAATFVLAGLVNFFSGGATRPETSTNKWLNAQRRKANL